MAAGLIVIELVMADPSVAVTAPVAGTLTGIDAILKTSPLLPAGMVTVGGTTAAGLLVVSQTLMPPAGAGPFVLITPLALPPPVIAAGETAKRYRTGAVTARLAEMPPEPFELSDAVIAPLEFTATGVVTRLKGREVCPAPIVTVAGTVAAGLALVR